jgi:hypothetical protein
VDIEILSKRKERQQEESMLNLKTLRKKFDEIGKPKKKIGSRSSNSKL